MSTKKDHREEQQRTLLQEFEVDVLELRNRGFTDTDIHSIVNMILVGWFKEGKPTQDYLEKAAAAVQLRQQAEEDSGFGLVDKFGSRIGS